MLSAESHTPVFSRSIRTRSCLACMHNPQHAVMTGLTEHGRRVTIVANIQNDIFHPEIVHFRHLFRVKSVVISQIPLSCNRLNSCVVAEVYPKIKVTGVFPLINIQKKQVNNFVKELDSATCQEFLQQCIHRPHCRVLPADHRQSHRESVLLRMLHLVEFFLHHGYVISFVTDKALTHSSCLQ